MATTETKKWKCRKCGKRTRGTGYWYCESCWREFDKEVDIPIGSVMARLSLKDRCLLLLYLAGRDVSEYFDSYSVPAVNEPEMDVMDIASYTRRPGRWEVGNFGNGL